MLNLNLSLMMQRFGAGVGIALPTSATIASDRADGGTLVAGAVTFFSIPDDSTFQEFWESKGHASFSEFSEYCEIVWDVDDTFTFTRLGDDPYWIGPTPTTANYFGVRCAHVYTQAGTYTPTASMIYLPTLEVCTLTMGPTGTLTASNRLQYYVNSSQNPAIALYDPDNVNATEKATVEDQIVTETDKESYTVETFNNAQDALDWISGASSLRRMLCIRAGKTLTMGPDPSGPDPHEIMRDQASIVAYDATGIPTIASEQAIIAPDYTAWRSKILISAGNSTPIRGTVATASQTIFNGVADVATNALVYVNDALQTVTTDYTKTGARQITFTSGLTAGDVVWVVNPKTADGTLADDLVFVDRAEGGIEAFFTPTASPNYIANIKFQGGYDPSNPSRFDVNDLSTLDIYTKLDGLNMTGSDSNTTLVNVTVDGFNKNFAATGGNSEVPGKTFAAFYCESLNHKDYGGFYGGTPKVAFVGCKFWSPVTTENGPTERSIALQINGAAVKQSHGAIRSSYADECIVAKCLVTSRNTWGTGTAAQPITRIGSSQAEGMGYTWSQNVSWYGSELGAANLPPNRWIGISRRDSVEYLHSIHIGGSVADRFYRAGVYAANSIFYLPETMDDGKSDKNFEAVSGIFGATVDNGSILNDGRTVTDDARVSTAPATNCAFVVDAARPTIPFRAYGRQTLALPGIAQHCANILTISGGPLTQVTITTNTSAVSQDSRFRVYIIKSGDAREDAISTRTSPTGAETNAIADHDAVFTVTNLTTGSLTNISDEGESIRIALVSSNGIYESFEDGDQVILTFNALASDTHYMPNNRPDFVLEGGTLPIASYFAVQDVETDWSEVRVDGSVVADVTPFDRSTYAPIGVDFAPDTGSALIDAATGSARRRDILGAVVSGSRSLGPLEPDSAVTGLYTPVAPTSWSSAWGRDYIIAGDTVNDANYIAHTVGGSPNPTVETTTLFQVDSAVVRVKSHVAVLGESIAASARLGHVLQATKVSALSSKTVVAGNIDTQNSAYISNAGGASQAYRRVAIALRERRQEDMVAGDFVFKSSNLALEFGLAPTQAGSRYISFPGLTTPNASTIVHSAPINGYRSILILLDRDGLESGNTYEVYRPPSVDGEATVPAISGTNTITEDIVLGGMQIFGDGTNQTDAEIERWFWAGTFDSGGEPAWSDFFESDGRPRDLGATGVAGGITPLIYITPDDFMKATFSQSGSLGGGTRSGTFAIT